ncbi:MAG: hypothetical protein M1816_004163 [Peltula sp. TS41687]|nr:MAG: hypothetical protein M1816_004163 [Peltula sp. TS41687]
MDPPDMVALQESLTDAVIARLFPETSECSMIDDGYSTISIDQKPLPSGPYVARPDPLRIPLPDLWTSCDDSVVSNESDQSALYDHVASPTEFPFPACNRLYDVCSTDPPSTATNHAQAHSALPDVGLGDGPGKRLAPQGSPQGCQVASTIPWSPVTLPDLCSSGRQYVDGGDGGETYRSPRGDAVSPLSPCHRQPPDGNMSPFTAPCSAQMSDSTLKSGSLPACQKQVKKVDSKKRGHNIVERRYRTNLNEKLERLRERIPTLCVNKGNVLEKAAEYIEELESSLKDNLDENVRLRFRIQTLEKIMMMDQGTAASTFINSGNLLRGRRSS